MWNFLVGGLLAGSTIVLYDGQPDPVGLWSFAAEAGVSCFGTSAGFITACMKAGVEPPRPRRALRSVGSTGSPLPVGGLRVDLRARRAGHLAFLHQRRHRPVHGVRRRRAAAPGLRGRAPGPCLGAKVESWDEEGRPLDDEVGELVITEPMPSMPLFFWNDPDGERYRSSYFDMYPGRLASRRLDQDHPAWRGRDLRALGLHDQPPGRAHGDGRDLQRRRGGARGARQHGARRAAGRWRVVDAALRGPARGRAPRRRPARTDRPPRPRALLAAARARRGHSRSPRCPGPSAARSSRCRSRRS